jgi:hypothetical protein
MAKQIFHYPMPKERSSVPRLVLEILMSSSLEVDNSILNEGYYLSWIGNVQKD